MLAHEAMDMLGLADPECTLLGLTVYRELGLGMFHMPFILHRPAG